MKTNYNNLSAFEACIVIVAIIGLALIGVEIYMSLPHNQQAAVSDAFAIFDMHEDVGRLQGNASFAMDSMQTFYDQFYIAFAESFSFPDQIGTPVQNLAESVRNYSSAIAYNYQQNIQSSQDRNAGEVLGSILMNLPTHSSAQQNVILNSSEQATAPTHFYKEYYYHAPTIVQSLLKQK